VNKRQRLNKRNDFQALYHHGIKVSLRGMVLYGYPNTIGVQRFGIVISKKMGNAVVRNRFKRRMRVLFASCQQLLSMPCDTVWIAARPSITKSSFQSLQMQMRSGCLQLAARM
jgi:ribonuclease P protein component